MKTEKFLPRAGSARLQLETAYEELTSLVDDGMANKETGHLLEGAAGAISAAIQLLELAEKGCDDKEHCP